MLILLTGMCVQVFSEMCALFEPFAAHCAWVSPVPAVHPQDVGLDVTVAGEQLEADPTSVLVPHVHGVQLLILKVLLEVVSLKHHFALDGLVATRTRVWRVDVFVVWGARQVVHTLVGTAAAASGARPRAAGATARSRASWGCGQRQYGGGRGGVGAGRGRGS